MVEADGFGGGVLRIVRANFLWDILIRDQHELRDSEEEALKRRTALKLCSFR